MKEIFNISKLISVITITFSSNIGTAFLILSFVIVDAIGTGLGVANIFRERLEELPPALAFKISLSIGVLFASACLIGIVITSLKGSMKMTNIFITLVSAYFSFIGFIKYILPVNFTFDLLIEDSALLIAVLGVLGMCLVPSVVINHSAKELTSNKANNEEIKRLTEDIAKQASKMIRESFENMNKPKEPSFKVSKPRKVA